MKLQVTLIAVSLGFCPFYQRASCSGLCFGVSSYCHSGKTNFPNLPASEEFRLCSEVLVESLGLAFVNGIGTCILVPLRFCARACVHACGHSAQLPETLPSTRPLLGTAATEIKLCCILGLVRPTHIESDDSSRHS